MSTASQLVCYFNDRFLPCAEIVINPRDLGFLRGYAVFDVMPVEHGKPFLWERHYERLCRSAAALNLRVPASREEFKDILDQLIGRNAPLALSLRTVLSGGPSASGFVPEAGKETFLVLAEAAHPYPAGIYEQGVTAMTLEYERPMPQVKLANHAIAISDLPRRKEAGAFEAIYVSDGQVSEATQSNLFIVRDGRLITTWDNVLWGVTQVLTLELAERLGIVTEKRALGLRELLSADEAFVTGSSKRIVPVVRIDETVIGAGVPGEMTRRLMAAFDDFVKKY